MIPFGCSGAAAGFESVAPLDSDGDEYGSEDIGARSSRKDCERGHRIYRKGLW
jgi:hypothetical protein